MDRKILLGILLIFCLNPFVGMLAVVFMKMFAVAKDTKGDFLVFIVMTVYACLLQSTAIWNPTLPTDWYSGGYWGLYELAGNSTFSEYIFNADKEPGWRFLNYIAHPFFGDNYLLFINGIVIASIVLICSSIYIYWRKTEVDSSALVLSLSLIVWFSEYNSNLINISRHFFALSLVTFVYVWYNVHKKVLWPLLVAACAIHTLACVFSLLLFIRPLFRVVKKKDLFYILIVSAFVVFFVSKVSILSSALSGFDSLSYGLSRLESSRDPMDQNFMNLSSVYTVVALFFGVSIWMNYFGKVSQFTVFFTNALTLLMLVCAAIATMMPEIMGRIYVSRFYFFPFVLPYIFSVKGKVLHRPFCSSVAVFLCFRYFYNFDAIRGGGFFPEFSDLANRTFFEFLF